MTMEMMFTVTSQCGSATHSFYKLAVTEFKLKHGTGVQPQEAPSSADSPVRKYAVMFDQVRPSLYPRVVSRWNRNPLFFVSLRYALAPSVLTHRSLLTALSRRCATNDHAGALDGAHRQDLLCKGRHQLLPPHEAEPHQGAREKGERLHARGQGARDAGCTVTVHGARGLHGGVMQGGRRFCARACS